MTQLEIARSGKVSEEMGICAGCEGVETEFIRKGVEDGNIVVIRNKNIPPFHLLPLVKVSGQRSMQISEHQKTAPILI
jgi:hydroxymethylpyrimidine synthase